MKTDADLEQIFDTIRADRHLLRCDVVAPSIKLLRSIGIDALRHAREMVEKAGDDDLGHARILAGLAYFIRDQELK